MNIQFSVSADVLDTTDVILVPCVKGEYKLLDKALKALPQKNWVDAATEIKKNRLPEPKKTSEQYLGNTKIILVGVDKTNTYTQNSQAIRSVIHKSFEKDKKFHVGLVLYDGLSADQSSAFANGLRLANMRIDYYLSERADNKADLTIYCAGKKIKSAAESGCELAQIQEEICHLVNLPSNEKNPKYLVDWAKEKFANTSVQVSALDHKQIQNKGMGALYTVGKGSKTPPYLLVLEYKPTSGKKWKHIGLIGKGVTFDTGGISLKDPLNMHLMKSDMGGAAAVLGTMFAIDAAKLKVQATAVIPLAENAIGPDAYRPGDVIKAMNGKSIEVIDTDAEGRLILADALSYMVKNYAPDHIIDLATLTGSIIMTLGYRAAGLFSKDEYLIKTLLKAAQKTGERLWSMPMWDDYMEEMNSDIADIKNLNTKPGAGAITAAKFLEAFTNNHPSWAHLDIAGVAMTDNDYSKFRSATAYGVLLLKEWIQSLQD